jgi:hypothetical protein
VRSAAAGLTAILAALIFVVVGIIGWSVGRGAVVASGGTVAVLAQTTSPHRWKMGPERGVEIQMLSMKRGRDVKAQVWSIPGLGRGR